MSTWRFATPSTLRGACSWKTDLRRYFGADSGCGAFEAGGFGAKIEGGNCRGGGGEGGGSCAGADGAAGVVSGGAVDVAGEATPTGTGSGANGVATANPGGWKAASSICHSRNE